MVTASAVAAKAPNAAEPLKGETNNAYVPADGVSLPSRAFGRPYVIAFTIRVTTD